MKLRQTIVKGVRVEDVLGEFPFAVLKRYFLCDCGQLADFPSEDGAVSYIVQPTLGPYNCALWVLEAFEADSIVRRDGVTEVLDGDNLHVFHAGLTAGTGSIIQGNSELETQQILERYQKELEHTYGICFADNCIRTWFFCHDIDNNYAGLVKARRENFTRIGLTQNTHYIASTGICGTPTQPGLTVQMDAWAIKGPLAARQQYLYAPTHLNPTYQYGVTFERGVKVGGFTIISGTASIDNKGAVLYIGDVERQTLRMWENVEQLLLEAGAGWDNVGAILVYIRRPQDYPIVERLFARKFSGVPYVILQAPVCRPDWLIEMETIACTGV